ncbi:MAG: hypothetical protein AMXMBFR48_16830 [Ignavibacteriales bacterium]
MKVLLAFVLLTVLVSAQSPDIVQCLRLIESGQSDSVAVILQKSTAKDTPAYIFLDALLTEDDKAAVKFEQLLSRFPSFAYNDAALFRLHSYYYALGSYSRAKELAENLKSRYPNSPYLKQIAKVEYSEDITENSESETPVAQPEIKSVYYSLQAGAFLNRQNAERLLKTLAAKGLDSFLEEKEIGGSLFYIVLVGQFDTEQEALTIKKQVESETKTDSKVVKGNR